MESKNVFDKSLKPLCVQWFSKFLAESALKALLSRGITGFINYKKNIIFGSVNSYLSNKVSFDSKEEWEEFGFWRFKFGTIRPFPRICAQSSVLNEVNLNSFFERPENWTKPGKNRTESDPANVSAIKGPISFILYFWTRQIQNIFYLT